MILVLGQNGQVARALARLAPSARVLSRTDADFSVPEAAAARLAAVLNEADEAERIDAVVNAAAYTGVDAAETDEPRARAINAEAPARIAALCAARGLPLVHLSTDYVFDGSGTAPHTPGDPPAPLNVYGRTKEAGEAGIRAAGGVHAILRTSWVFSASGRNFVTAMLSRPPGGPPCRVVADQVGGPTPAPALAAACLAIAARLRTDPDLTGTYHFAGAPDVSWAAFARAIFAAAGRSDIVEDVSTAAYPTAARRPLNSRLECSDTEAAFGLTRPDWRAALPGLLAEMCREAKP